MRGLSQKGELNMKEKFLVSLVIGFLMFGMAGIAQANLIDLNSSLVLDNESGVVWYRNVTLFKNQTRDEQLDSIAALSSSWDIDADGSVDNLSFRMATFEEASSLLATYNLGDGDAHAAREEAMSHFSLSYDHFEQYDDSYIDEVIGRIDRPWPNAMAGMQIFQYYKIDDDSFLNGSAFVMFQNDFANAVVGAWVVADVNPVPVPSTIILLGFGILGLAGVNRRSIK